jgi:hypothetical protein
VYSIAFAAEDKDDKIQALVAGAVQGATTSGDLYCKLLDFITRNAGPDGPAFLNPAFGLLSFKMESLRSGLVLRFEPSEIWKRELRIRAGKAKVDALLAFFTAVQADGYRKAAAVFGSAARLYNDDGKPSSAVVNAHSKANEIWADVDQGRLEPLAGLNALDKLIAQIVALAAPTAVASVKQIAQAPSYEAMKRALVAKLTASLPTKDDPLLSVTAKQRLVDVFMAASLTRMIRTAKTRATAAHGVVVPTLVGLGFQGQVTSIEDAMEKLRLGIRDLVDRKRFDLRPELSLEHINKLCYAASDRIVQRACADYERAIEQELGITTLSRAGKGTVSVADDEMSKLLPPLMDKVETLLQTLTVKLDVPGSRETAVAKRVFKPYVFYRGADYGRAMPAAYPTLQPDEKTASCETLISSIDVPLVEVGATALMLLNCGKGLFLTDPRETDRVYWFKNGAESKSVGFVKDPKSPNQETLLVELWGNRAKHFSFRRTYFSLYVLPADPKAEIASHAAWRKATGFSRGDGRADTVPDSDYVWQFAGDIAALSERLSQVIGRKVELTVPQLGAFLKLDEENRRQDAAWNPGAGANGYGYVFVRTPSRDGEEALFAACRTPFAPSGLETPVETAAKETLPLDKLGILYFRRASFAQDEDLVTVKVVKDGAGKNRPRTDDVPDDDVDPATGEIGVNLPLALQVAHNYRQFQQMKTGENGLAVIKNKANPLTVNFRAREDAGRVMRDIAPFLGNSVPASLSASQLANVIIEGSAAARDAWRALKLHTLNVLPTDQEWCHLLGHGDGGDERIGNFVSGSYHCNTEQLAIESAQRPVTHRSKYSKAGAAEYILNSTAYLLPDKSMTKISNATYLGRDDSYVADGYAKNLKLKPENAERAEQHRRERARAGANAPLAVFVRYKIFRKDGEKVRKLFDYVFEAQSEFFDIHQYTILFRSVQFVLDQDAFFRDLADACQV